MIITKSAAGSASWIHGCFDYVLVIKKLTKQNHYEYIDVPIQKYIKDCKDGFFFAVAACMVQAIAWDRKNIQAPFFTGSVPVYFFRAFFIILFFLLIS